MKRNAFFSNLAITVIFLLVAGLTLNVDAQVVKKGDIAPDFTLQDMDGNEHTLYEYEGYVIFFNIFGVT